MMPRYHCLVSVLGQPLPRHRYPTLYEIEYEIPAAILVVLGIDPKEDISRVQEELYQFSAELDTWVHLAAARLARDEERLRLVLELLRRGYRPRQENVSRVMEALGA